MHTDLHIGIQHFTKHYVYYVRINPEIFISKFVKDSY